VRYVATCKPKPADETYPKAAAPAYAARLMLNTDTEYALRNLDAAATFQIEKAKRKLSGTPRSSPALDPFDKVALVNTYCACNAKWTLAHYAAHTDTRRRAHRCRSWTNCG
jgi:hypothetical protein